MSQVAQWWKICRSAEATDSIHVSGKFPEKERQCTPVCSVLENPTDRVAWLATVPGVAKEADIT